MIKPEDVTIIIPHLGANEESRYALKECMDSLDETVPKIKKILVVNGNAYPLDGTPGISGIDNWERIELTTQGQCKAVNAAVATVNTPWVFITNDDMIYAPGWFERLVGTVNMAGIKCISPQLVEPTQGAPTFLTHFCGGAGGDFDKQKWLEFAKNHKGDLLPARTGFNLPFLISKELWDLIGGYDINYDPWGSNGDSDLEYKIKLAGVQPYQNTNCIIYHFSQTSGTFTPQNQSYWQKNWDYFIQKWGFPRAESPEIWEANFEIPAIPIRKFKPIWENTYGN